MSNLADLSMSSEASSLKILKEGSGTLSVPALGGAGQTYGSATIAHNFGSDNLIFQVATSGGPTSGVVIPWESNDGRIIQYACLDSTNLYIYVISSDSSGFGAPAYTITYDYRVIIP